MSDDVGNLGNFKGVMLCNRPAQIPGSLQTVVGVSGTSGPQRPAFVSAVVADGQLGLPPIKGGHRYQRPEANKELDVTFRHKRWLSQFGESRNKIQEQMERRVQEQQERAKRFAERSQAMRDAIRGIKASGDSTDRATKSAAVEAALGLSARPKFVPTEYVEVSQQYPKGAPVIYSDRPDPTQEQLVVAPAAAAPAAAAAAAAPARPAAAAKPSKKASDKPGWARTSSEADDFLDLEADSLVDFAQGLDYQSYIDDLEVREAIKFVQQRVAGLEESARTEESAAEQKQRLIDAGELEEIWVVDESAPPNPETGEPVLKKVVRRTKRAQKAALNMVDEQAEWNASTAAQQSGDQSHRDRAAQQEALSRTVLDSNRNLRNIHSSASVRAIIDKEGATPRAAAAAPSAAASTLRRSQLASIPEPALAVQPPVISTIHERDQKGDKSVNPSNLPFLYRHPGI